MRLPEGRFAGILTEHDLAWAVADGAEAELATVGGYMTEQPATIPLDADVREAVTAPARPHEIPAQAW